MAHELETHEDGRVAMVSGMNIDPWHRLGTVLPGGLTADEALEKAFLRDWGITKEQVYVHLDQLTASGVETQLVAVPGQFTIVRSNPFTKQREVLGAETKVVTEELENGGSIKHTKVIRPGGTVGSIYRPFQNEEGVAFMEAVTDEYGEAVFETAGSIRGGAQTFVTMRLRNFTVDGRDGHTMYLVYLFNHLTGSNQVFVTHIRVVCANTVDAAVGSARYMFRHSASIDVRHEQARSMLKLAFDYSEKFEAQAEQMIAEKCNLDEFRRVCDEIWPPLPRADDMPEDKRPPEIAYKREHARGQQLKELFLFSETQEEIRGTKWCAYNALVEYMDHFSSVRGTSDTEKAKARAYRTIDGIDVKEKAFKLLTGSAA